MLFSKKKSSSSVGLIAVVVTAYSLGSAYVCLAQTKTAALPPAATPAGGAAAPTGPVNTTPVDISADSQDFAGDVVLCHGNVRVKFKDSVITAPEAQLFKDASGQAQLAIFTGHPHLVQKSNKIDADKLTFQMAISKIIADGHAHAEVSGDAEDSPPTPGGNPTPPGISPTLGGGDDKMPANAGAMPKIRFPMDTDPQPAPKKVAAAPAPAPKPAAPAAKPKKAEAGSWQMDEETADAPPVAPGAAAPAGEATAKDAPASNKAAERIIVDSEHQEYEQDTGHFVAVGHCKVKHGEMRVDSHALNMVYGADGKPETALFSGSVSATQNGNNTKSDHMTYSLSTQRLQASGNVRSKVLQQRPATSEPKKGAQSTLTQATSEEKVKVKTSDGTVKELTAAEAEKYGFKSEKAKKKTKTFELTMDSEEPIYIISDSQDFTKSNGRMSALGNVHVYYNDNKGLGHKCLLIRNDEGKAEKMIFTGRSQIIQPGKRWIGDKITFLVPTEHVVAEGNTRAIILNTNAQVVGPLATSADENANAETASSEVEAQVLPMKDGEGASSSSTEIATPSGVPQ